jgi:hypothetical protein
VVLVNTTPPYEPQLEMGLTPVMLALVAGAIEKHTTIVLLITYKEYYFESKTTF